MRAAILFLLLLFLGLLVVTIITLPGWSNPSDNSRYEGDPSSAPAD